MEELSYTFEGLDEALNTELQMQDRLAWQMADSFVRTGYYLRIAQDTNVLDGSGYGSVEDYGQRRFGLDKSRVSRYININKEYSKDGYSMELQDRYQGFGWSKLALMLSLPEPIREEISPAYTKSEIQAIKDEVDEENKISDIEVMLEEPQKAQIELGTTLMKVIYQIMHDYKDIFRQLDENAENAETTYNVFVGDEEACYNVRIQGMGRYQVFMRDLSDQVTIVSVRTGERENVEWADIWEAVKYILTSTNADDTKTAYETIYGEPFTDEEQTANEPKKTGKVKTAAKPHNDSCAKPVENTTKNEEKNTNIQDFPMNPPEETENRQIYHDCTIFEEPQDEEVLETDGILRGDGQQAEATGQDADEPEEVEQETTDQETTGQQGAEEPDRQQGTEEPDRQQDEQLRDEAAKAWNDLRTLASTVVMEIPSFHKYCTRKQLVEIRSHAWAALAVMDRFLNGDFGGILEDE